MTHGAKFPDIEARMTTAELGLVAALEMARSLCPKSNMSDTLEALVEQCAEFRSKLKMAGYDETGMEV